MDLAKYKLVKTTLVSLALVGFGSFAILQGADPTLTATVTVMVIGLIAGVEFSELVASMSDVDDGN